MAGDETVLGWFATPIIKSLLDGTLSMAFGVCGSSGKELAARPIPAWVGVSGVLAVAVAIPVVAKLRKRNKVGVRIVVLPTPPAKWGIGAIAILPVLHLHLSARIAHCSGMSLEIVKAYLEGQRQKVHFCRSWWMTNPR